MFRCVALVLLELVVAFTVEAILIALGTPVYTWVLFALVAGGVLFFTLSKDDTGPKTFRPPLKEELLSENKTPSSERQQPRQPKSLASRSQRPAENQLLANCLVPIFVELIRSDGEVSQQHIRTIRNFFIQSLSFSTDELEWVRGNIKDALAAPAQELDFLILRARNAVKPELRVELLSAFYAVCLVDGALRLGERDALRQIVNHFHLSDEQLQRVTQAFFGDGAAHFEALELTADATNDEVKAAFRRLAAQHHPDRVANADSATIEKSAATFRQISEAFEAIQRLRGF